MKTIKAPFAARAPTWLGRVECRERLSRLLEASLGNIEICLLRPTRGFVARFFRWALSLRSIRNADV